MDFRPPVGFIVEGHGEYNCYPSLFSKINSSAGFKVPIVNAGGCGSIVRRLPQQINDLLLVDSPENIVITVDLKDVIAQNLAKDEEELLSNLRAEVQRWEGDAKNDTRLHPLPKRIVCLAQVLKFESWLIADLQGLKKAMIVRADVDQVEDAEAISEPATWLKRNLVTESDIKNPRFAKAVVSAIDPSVMKEHSRSFASFFECCQSMYSKWQTSFNEDLAL